ncbi:hypothetical protein K435DRAFT_813644 [Dendrothele bispora CBS 962.96]|uniref:Uncharacterized protein n=1 Tax=Dendrothele bispora (strain CBS 962.96) TaxID=1314807 RepID=A0A4S8KL73_DENBC|nr:hypothetical protein K435DRAFT_813644 [Dendrothele bispora CBS 962.96]
MTDRTKLRRTRTKGEESESKTEKRDHKAFFELVYARKQGIIQKGGTNEWMGGAGKLALGFSLWLLVDWLGYIKPANETMGKCLRYTLPVNGYIFLALIHPRRKQKKTDEDEDKVE